MKHLRHLSVALLCLCLAVVRTTAQGTNWIPAGATWKFFRGTTEASSPNITAWRQVAFNDSTWESGRLPIFYGEDLDGTRIDGMQNQYSSIFLRKTFTSSNPDDVSSLLLRVKVDDGFVAWINGIEVARFGAPEGEIRFNSFASIIAPEPAQFEEYEVSQLGSTLRSGLNVLAIQVFNANLPSSDLVLDAELQATIDSIPPTVKRLDPIDGAVVRELESVEILFSEGVIGVDASDLTINGVPATNVVEISPEQYVFTFPAAPTGNVTLSIGANSGITDRSTVGYPFAGLTWHVGVDPNAPSPGVTISEFLASNDRGIRDDDGDRSDWIELHNGGSNTVSLAGWSLADSGDTWRFPGVSLAANERMLVWASGKNRTNAAAPLHTNFRLSADGERLALMSPSGEIVYQYAAPVPAQRPDVSYGHVEGAPTRQGFFATPTPRAPNSTRGDGFAPDVIFSASSGTYSGTMQITLTPGTNTTATNVVIRYTLNGSQPTETSTVYGGPITFTNQAVQVRARAFATPLFPGDMRSETYIPLSVPVASFRSDLPVMLIHDFGAGRPPANSRVFAHIQIFEPGTNGFTSLNNAPTLSTRAGISVRGSSTEGIEKASYRLEFRDEYDNDRKLGPLGMPADGDWVMYAPNFFEPVMIHNPFMHQLSRDIGRYSPRTKFVEVYFVGSGTGQVQQSSYAGIYVLTERIEIGGDRVDAGGLQAENIRLPELSGGYLMKVDRLDPGDFGLGTANQLVAMVDPSEAELRSPERTVQFNYLRDYMNAFGSALYDNSRYTNPVTGFRAYIDEGSWIDHHLLNVLAFNVDALRLSAYFYKQRNGKLVFGPLWDFDRALGSTDGRDANPRVWKSQSGDGGTDFFYYTWWDRMFTDSEFFQAYIDRYQELRRDQFSTTNLWRLIDDLANEVRTAQPREQAKWGVLPRGGSYQSEVNLMKAWISNRVSFMDSQFVSAPRLSAPSGRVESGFTVTITPPSGLAVYYTLDGSDPRLPGGRINPSATLYAGSPVPITANTRLIARAINPSHNPTGFGGPPLRSTWSGSAAATFIVTPSALVVSELMYHPDDGGAEGDADDLEFIELLNTGSNAVPLAGFSLRGVVSYDWASTNTATLQPGARGLLVRNLARFTAANPTVTGVTILGEYGPAELSNSSGQLSLTGSLGEPIFDFIYRDSWQPLTDGAGFSLVPASESSPGDPALPISWRRSARTGGSPGSADPEFQYAPAPLLVNFEASGDLRLRFNAASGTGHKLEERTDLGAGSWNLLRSFDGTLTNRVEDLTVPATNSVRFFRLLKF
jgi:hypothetical protein